MAVVRGEAHFEEVEPFAFAVPVLREVQGEAAPAVAGGAGGDRDQVAADGRGPGPGQGKRGEGAGGADQVEGHRGDDQPGGVGGEPAGREVGERSVVPVGEDLLHDRVAAVLGLGLDQLERGVGEDRVVAPGGEQLALAGGGLRAEVADPADDEPGGDLQVFPFRGEGRVGGLGDLGVGGPAVQLVVPDGPG
jgi:hypothetical protein